MSPIRLAAPALAFACLVASAQTPEPPSFPIQAEMVTVDVVVTDESGAPVRGLKREDFVIQEDGQARPLALFEAIESPAGSSRSAPMGSVSDNLAPAVARPLIVILFDEPHLTPGNVERARERFRTPLVHRELGTADVVLTSSSGGAWHLRLPEDAADLSAALARFKGARPSQTPGRMKDLEAFQIAARRNEQVLTEVFRRYLDLRLLTDPTVVVDKGPKLKQNDGSAALPSAGRSAVMVEAEERWQGIRRRQAATVAGLTRMLEGLEVRKGRKALLLVTEGFLHEGALPEYRQLAEAARRARASVNIVDPRDAGRLFDDEADTGPAVEISDRIGLMAREMKAAEGADALAAATGGTVLRHLPGLPAALHTIGSDLRTYYLLGFEPQAPRDGAFHELKVETSRPGVRIGARPGYYALDARPARAAAPTTLAQEAMDAPLDASDLPLRLAGYVLGPAKKGRTQVRLVAEVDGAALAAGRPLAALDAVFQLAARERPEAQQWATVIKMPSSDKTVRVEAEFEAEPGVYQARVVAREQRGSRTGSVRHLLEVPPQDAFRSSTPILTDLATGNVPVPRADRRFRRDAKLFCMIEVMGAPASASVVAGVDLRQPDGNVRLRIPATPMSSLPRSRMWAIPLADLPPGPYELMISVQDVASHRTVGMREGFEVVSND